MESCNFYDVPLKIQILQYKLNKASYTEIAV